MDPRILDMFRYCGNDDLTTARHGINLEFLRVFHELAHHDRMFSRYVGGLVQEPLEFHVVRSNSHCGAAKDIGRPHKDRVADTTCKPPGVVNVDQFSPLRLFDSQFVQQR